MTPTRLAGSFRDPAGFLFERDGRLLRQIQPCAADDWTALHDGGLLARLHGEGLLVRHTELPVSEGYDARAYRVIAPERIPWISYPYEWTPRQLAEAARLTLRVQRLALAHGMTLKDASAFNVQFIGHRPAFVDSLSFTVYREGEPWVAYRQFCQHFVAPLAVMADVDPRLRELLRSHLDGLPLDLASRLLPWRSRLHPTRLVHLHLHARGIRQHAGRATPAAASRRGVSRSGLEAILDHLESAVAPQGRRTPRTEWQDYEADHRYSSRGQEVKEGVIGRWAEHSGPRLAFDLGANAGHYSSIVARTGAYVVAMDGDLGATERLVQRTQEQGEERILALWLDLANPSPNQGWNHAERSSLADRGPADLVLALALLHHLAIGNNVPMTGIADMLATVGREVILEWVPKHDPQAQRLLVSRPDTFPDYTHAHFLDTIAGRFEIIEAVDIPDGDRILYRLRRR